LRILILTPHYPSENNSVFSFVHSRAKIYLKKHDNVQVFVPGSTVQRRFFEGVKITCGNVQFFRLVLRDFVPDVIALHAPHYLEFRSFLKCLGDIPIVIWLHGSESLFYYYYKPPWNLKSRLTIPHDVVKFGLLRYLFGRVSAVVYVSDWLRKKVEQNILYRHPNSFVIPNPVDTDLFFFQNTRYSRSGVAVRGMDWKYGLDIVVSAYRSLPDAQLTILGSGSMEPYLRSIAKDNVTFITTSLPHDSMTKFYGRFGYFVAPSRLEAQGLSMCEAMSCGLPVVASKAGGIPEFVKDGVNGFLVPSLKPKLFAEAIRHLLSDQQQYNTLALDARRFAVNFLSYNRIYELEKSVFERVVNK
jgi:glycosyltransferase involved in cell wall biosynthesis